MSQQLSSNIPLGLLPPALAEEVILPVPCLCGFVYVSVCGHSKLFDLRPSYFAWRLTLTPRKRSLRLMSKVKVTKNKVKVTRSRNPYPDPHKGILSDKSHLPPPPKKKKNPIRMCRKEIFWPKRSDHSPQIKGKISICQTMKWTFGFLSFQRLRNLIKGLYPCLKHLISTWIS